jgi:Restriction endonuclease
MLTKRPQPIDYGLTFDDLNLYSGTGMWCRLNNGSDVQCFGPREGNEYKKGSRWFGRLTVHWSRYEDALITAFWLLVFGGVWVMAAKYWLISGLIFGLASVCLLIAFVLRPVLKRLRKRASPALEKYWQAVDRYEKEKAAIEEAARKAARDAELRKRSYWTFLDGYAFERATAEVLNKHQFNAWVTPGSGDGGVDIQVTRNSLKGIVQCKAHMACVGPHVVRDLYGVIHHCGAAFGIIVSLGGFTKGAVEFARDKPILFVNLDDLIAMQEGKDVLAAAFSNSSVER